MIDQHVINVPVLPAYPLTNSHSHVGGKDHGEIEDLWQAQTYDGLDKLSLDIV